MDEHNAKKRSIALAFSTPGLIISLVLLIMGMLVNNEIELTRSDTQEWLSIVDEWRFDYIMAVANEVNIVAQAQADTMRDSILSDIESRYGNDLGTLMVDLSSPDSNSDIYIIFMDNIEGKYITYDTNANVPYIFVAHDTDKVKGGIPGYLAATYSTLFQDVDTGDNNTSISMNDILSGAQDRLLNRAALRKILYGYDDNDLVFTRFFVNSDSKEIKYMTMSALRDAYKESGVAVFEDLTFITTSYIHDRSDIFGKLDIMANGSTPGNYKIIVAQTFSLSDVLHERHDIPMKRYELRMETVLHDGLERVHTLQVVLGIIVVTWVLLVGIIISLQNMFVKRIEAETANSNS